MRLAQIARKLKVKTSEVVALIEQKFEVQIEHAPNTKIPDEYVNTIIEHFSIEQEVTPESEQINPETTSEIAEIQEEIVPEVEEFTKPISEIKPEESTLEEKVESPIEVEELNIEDGVIKAPKVEVEGIKVVGKIELDNGKTKEEAEITDSEIEPVTESNNEVEVDNKSESNEETTIQEEVKVEKNQEIVAPTPIEKKKPSKVKKKQNVLTFDEERLKAQKKYREELKKKKEKEKKKRKANYDLMMKERNAKKPPKKSVVKKKKVEEATVNIPLEKKETSKTLWGKFIYWLNN